MRILHVGMPKTGSTSLQATLASVGMLANAADKKGKDHLWGMKAAGFELDREVLRRRKATVERVSGPVLSDESLCLADEAEANAVLDLYRPTTTLLVTRSFPDIAESWWAQAVKDGEQRSFQEWAEAYLFADPVETPEARWFRADWANAVWCPNEVWSWVPNIVEKFCSVFMPDSYFPEAQSNRTLSPEATEALRLANSQDNASWGLARVRASLLAKVDEPAARLITDESRRRLARYDQTIQAAMLLSEVAALAPTEVTVRPLDENRVNSLVALVTSR